MGGSHLRFAAGKLLTATLTVAVIAAVCGCGADGDRLQTYTVTGKVTFSDGKPWPELEGGRIILQSIEHEELSATGAIEPDGTFHQLTTYEFNDGAVAGPHRVAIMPPMRPNVDQDEVRLPPLIHMRFESLEASGLKLTVTEDGPNEFPLEVDRP